MSAQNRDWQRAEVAPQAPVCWFACALLAATAVLRADTNTVPPAPVATALEQLDADTFAVRERACHTLWQTGSAAEPYLERALGHPSIEVRMRARRVLQLLRFGLDANATPEHWAFISEFHSSDPQHQATLLFRMLQQGEVSLALRLLEGSGPSRAPLLAQLDGQLERMLPGALIAGDLGQARRIVDLLASGGQRMRYAAWFHLLTGTAADAAARLDALVAPGEIDRTRLYYLSTARGDVDAAAQLADTLQLSETQLGFGLSDITPAEYARRSAAGTRDQVELSGFLAAHGRLSGDDKAFRDNIAGLQRIARSSRAERPFCLEAMVINGALDAATRSAATAMEPFRIHARQWKVREALQALGITAQAPPFSPWIENLCASIEAARRLQVREELLTYPYALAELCMQTGEAEEAERLCRLTAAALLKADRLSFQQAIRHETELGLKELAMEHALQALTIGTPEISVFLSLYGKSNQHARNWFDYLRSREDDKPMPPEDRLRTLDLLLTPSPPDSEARTRTTELVTEAFAADNPLRGTRRASWATTLVYTASLHGIPLPPGFATAPSRSDAPSPARNDTAANLPMATRILGRPECVLSPHGIGWIIDVSTKAPGSVETCPYSGKQFVVPPIVEDASPLRPRSDDTIRALKDAGAAHLEAGRFGEAADTLQQALGAAGNEAAPQLLFLLGEALIRSGRDVAAGASRQLQARLLAPLTVDRLGFIEFLWQRGNTAMVAEECRFLHLDDHPRIAGADGRLFDVVAHFLADSDPLRAADLWEMQLLTGLRKQQGATLTQHLEARFRIHHTRAQGLRQLGDFVAALAELHRAAAMLPADARIAEALAPLLDSAPVQQEAADLLAQVRAAAEAAATQFPNSTLLRQNFKRILELSPQGQ